MKKFRQEFKEFISRGSVIDLAVGVIIGSAFTAIVNSLVNDIIMPLLSILFGGITFEMWNVTIGTGENAPVFAFGTFVAAVINFILIALVIFCIVKVINTSRGKMESLIKKEKKEESPTTKKCP